MLPVNDPFSSTLSESDRDMTGERVPKIKILFSFLFNYSIFDSRQSKEIEHNFFKC